MRWLAARVLKWSVGKQEQEVRDFVHKLSVVDSSELGLPVALATAYRHLVRRNVGIDLLFPATALISEPTICTRLNREIQELQRQRQFAGLAAGMIWLHSLRAMQSLELRPHGRELWRQLSRGFPHVLNSADDHALLTGVLLEIEDYDQIPDGLGPQT